MIFHEFRDMNKSMNIIFVCCVVTCENVLWYRECRLLKGDDFEKDFVASN